MRVVRIKDIGAGVSDSANSVANAIYRCESPTTGLSESAGDQWPEEEDSPECNDDQ